MTKREDKYKEFTDWFCEIENMGTRSERFYESLTKFESELGKNANLLVWLKAAWEASRETVIIEETIVYSEEYDAYYNAVTNEWIERRCDDRSCHYCINRPEKPLP